jgi:hypothetical protein
MDCTKYGDKMLTREELDKLLALMPDAKCIIVRTVTEDEKKNRFPDETST